MIDLKALQKVEAQSGFTRKFIVNSLGMSYDHYTDLIYGRVDWRLNEIARFCTLLHLKKKDRDSIFFTDKVHEMRTCEPKKTEVTE